MAGRGLRPAGADRGAGRRAGRRAGRAAGPVLGRLLDLNARPRRPWTAEEEAHLAAGVREGRPLADLALELGRTLKAVQARAAQLSRGPGLSKPTDPASIGPAPTEPAPAGPGRGAPRSGTRDRRSRTAEPARQCADPVPRQGRGGPRQDRGGPVADGPRVPDQEWPGRCPRCGGRVIADPLVGLPSAFGDAEPACLMCGWRAARPPDEADWRSARVWVGRYPRPAADAAAGEEA